MACAFGRPAWQPRSKWYQLIGVRHIEQRMARRLPFSHDSATEYAMGETMDLGNSAGVYSFDLWHCPFTVYVTSQTTYKNRVLLIVIPFG